MMNHNLSLVLSLFLLAGIIVPAYAQTNSDGVVINEVDINPPGNDATSISEWVELYNPTDSEINLGGWKIASTTVLKKTMTLPDGTVIKPGQFLTYSYQSVWFTDSNDSVELRDENGIIIDKTPVFADIDNDFKSWQRIYDGFDSDSSDDWKFVTSTAGSSNGKLTSSQESKEITVTVSSEKPSYLFGDVAIIEGSVSEEVFTVQPFFKPESIIVNISGPNFDKTLTLYPDLNLNYDTTLSLQQVLGINEGTYDVSVTYAGATSKTSFYVGNKMVVTPEKETRSLSIFTDKSQYLPGEYVLITADTTNTIPFEGLKFKVLDPSQNQIYQGTLFPNSNTVADNKVTSGGDLTSASGAPFATKIFMTTIEPVYGTYKIIGEYFDQSAIATFEVIKDVKEDKRISLWTDNEVYGLGDTVTITGRLNDRWVDSLDLEVIQTKNLALGVGKNTKFSGGGSVFKILDAVTLDGDGKFQYSFTIPDLDSRLGDYWIKVSKDVGSASKSFVVTENPDEYVETNEDLSLVSDQSVYGLGDKMTISGKISIPSSRSSFETPPVTITVSTEDGKPLSIVGLPKGAKTLATGGIPVGIEFTAIPDSSGRFSFQTTVTKTAFSEGNYIIKAQYQNLSKSIPIEITDPLKTDIVTLSIDKDVYGFGETVHLTGLFPPVGDRSVSISLTKPDGSILNSGAIIDNHRFSWTWQIPSTEKPLSIKSGDDRSIISSNLGTYKIRVTTDTYGTNLFFKVSTDPENDSLSTIPLFVSTDKSLYKVGEKLKVIGNVIKREQGNEGLVIPERVQIKILDGTFPYKQIHESSVYPNQGGEFSSLFELPATIFREGPYTVKALYNNIRADATFSVTNDFVFGVDEPVSLLLSTDKSEYHPGDTVVISGKPNKLIYLEKFDVSVIQKTDTGITCGSFICGIHAGPVTSIRPSPSGSFTHQFMIPDSVSSIGSYEVTVDADFETKSIQFDVTEEPRTPKLNTVIEKQNRISETTIPISTEEKITDNVTIAPRVISGSLITPSRGDESNVNLKISTVTGTCIIGPDADCLVSESTRKPGQIYDVVEVDGVTLNVRYSGPDVRLEKFSILPESSDAFLPDTNWNVDVIKDDQASRFYYKITYKTLE